MKPISRPNRETASAKITERIQELGDWRGETLAHVRRLIHAADPDIQEEWKWMGTPVWTHDGGVCTGESYKQVVKLTFFRGASLKDPRKLFNASLEGSCLQAAHPRRGGGQLRRARSTSSQEEVGPVPPASAIRGVQGDRRLSGGVRTFFVSVLRPLRGKVKER